MMRMNLRRSHNNNRKQYFKGCLLLAVFILGMTTVMAQYVDTTGLIEDAYNAKPTPNTYTGERIYAQTTPATLVRTNTATLNGELAYIDSTVLAIQFEYTVYGEKKIVTATRIPNTDKLTADISGLMADTDVSFRIVTKTINGKKYGASNTFHTLPTPPKGSSEIARHNRSLGGWATGFFNPNNLAGTKKRLVNSCDYQNAKLRKKTKEVVALSPGSFNLGQICDIFDYCYNNWKYTNDPTSMEIYQKASQTLFDFNLSGDCDDFAILTCSMLLAIGGDARITIAFGSSGGHAFTEINMGKADMKKLSEYIYQRYKGVWSGKVHCRIDKNDNCWLNLDWWAKHPGGKYYNANRGTRFYILDNYCESF